MGDRRRRVWRAATGRCNALERDRHILSHVRAASRRHDEAAFRAIGTDLYRALSGAMIPFE